MKDRPNLHETPARIEPTRLEDVSADLTDVVAELSSSAESLGKGLHPATAASLSDLVRIMNTYYSNLIEGHNTRPWDIARAMTGDFDKDPERRNLQIEAAAHVRVQTEIDRLGRAGKIGEPAGRDFIRRLHREFYEGASGAMLTIKGTDSSFQMVPGERRSRPDHDV